MAYGNVSFCSLDMSTLYILSLSWFFSFKWSREKDEKNWGEAEQRLILETGQELQRISVGSFLQSAVTRPQQRHPQFTPSSCLPGSALIWAGYWLAPGDGGFRAWLCPQTLYRAAWANAGTEVPCGHSLGVSSLTLADFGVHHHCNSPAEPPSLGLSQRCSISFLKPCRV